MQDTNRKWTVMVAILLTNLIGSGTLFSSGILYVAMLDKYDGDKTKAAIVLALNSGLLCVLGPFTTTVVNRFSCRVAMVSGGVLLALSALTSAFATNLYVLMLTYGILGGIGNSLTLVPCSLVLCFYFQDHRDLIITLSNGSIGLAMLMASPMTLFFLQKFALNGTFLMLGALNFHICIAGMIAMPTVVEKQANMKTKQRKEKKIRMQTATKQIAKSTLVTLQSRCPSIKPSFILFLLSTSCWNFVLSDCLVHLPNFARVNGFNNERITLLMTCLSICNTVGRFLPAIVSKVRGTTYIILHFLALGLMGAVVVTFPIYSNSDVMKYVLAGVVGLFTGLANTLMTLITIVIVGVANISTSHGLAYFSCGIGAFLGPGIVGYLYGVSGSYTFSFIFAGIVSLIGSGVSFTAWLKIRANPNTDEVGVDVDNDVRETEDI